MTITSRLEHLERVISTEPEGRRPLCPHPFHRDFPGRRVAALPLSPEWDGVAPRCPACHRERGGIHVEAVEVDLRLRPVPVVSQ